MCTMAVRSYLEVHTVFYYPPLSQLGEVCSCWRLAGLSSRRLFGCGWRRFLVRYFSFFVLFFVCVFGTSSSSVFLGSWFDLFTTEYFRSWWYSDVCLLVV
ncbi:unnamed protein product [Ectocarpus sp. 12 AP-2014]